MLEVQEMFNSKNTRDGNSKKKQKSPKKNAGFYIALAICMVTVAAAAWTTYGSVMDYNELAEESSEASEHSDVKTANEVSGEKYQTDSAGETQKSSTETDEQSLPQSSETVQESSEVGAYPPKNKKEDSDVSILETVVDTSRRMPIENGKLIKKFSPNNPIRSKTMSDWRTHDGADIAASKGTPVRAITGGTVKMIYKDALLGNVTVIEHTGRFTAYYCGLSDTPIAKAGNTVSTGDTIGYVGIVPGEVLDESHLHLEIRKDNELIDPTSVY